MGKLFSFPLYAVNVGADELTLAQTPVPEG